MPTINKKQIQIHYLKKEKNKERHTLYNNSQWRKLRKIYKESHPLCEECLKNDIIKTADDIHHIKSPFDPNISEMEKWQRLLDYSNLMALCKACHGKIHANQQKNSKKINKT